MSGSLFCTDSYTPITEDVGCYKKYDGTTDTSDCTAVDVTTCTGNNCKVVCQESSGVLTTCSEVCASYSCSTETTYRGPGSCTISTEEVCTTRTRIDASAIDIGTCSPASSCNEFGCWATGCSPCTSAGCPACGIGDVYSNDVVCDDFSACVSYTSPVGCISDTTPQGFPLLVQKSDDEFLQCSPQPSVKEGDIWCPEGFEYDDGNSRCEEQLEVCDFGPTGALHIGCNIITNNANDSWGRYNTGCVWDWSPEATSLLTYDKSCCLNSMLNGHELYTDGIEEDFVKVY